jgi:uroporphyrinogen-III synthase
MKKVFITRDLEEDSSLVEELLEKNLLLHGQSLIEFTRLPFTKVPQSDWIFFYSKQGIRHYFDGLDDPACWTGVRMGMLRKVKQLKYATFGKGSAGFLKSCRNINPDFEGTGKAETTAQTFLKKAKNKKVLFVRGKNSLQSVQHLLKENKMDQIDFLLFTSPLNAQAYYQRYAIKRWQKVFAIGETTAEALLSLGLKDIRIASSPSISAMIELVLLESNS